MKPWLVLSFLLLVRTAAAQTVYHTHVPQTSCHLVPPEGFEPADGFNGFQHAASGSLIMVNEIPTPYEALLGGLNAKALLSKQMTLVDKQEVRLNQGRATLIRVSQPMDGVSFVKQMLLYGDEVRTLLITGIYPDSNQQFGEPIRSSLLTAVFDAFPLLDPLAGVPFRVRVQPENLKLTRYVAGSLIYTSDAALPAGKASLTVGHISKRVAPEDRELFCLGQLRTLPDALQKRLDPVREVVMDKLPGYEIVARGKNRVGQDELVCQVLLFTKTGTCYYLVGIATGDHDRYLDRFRKIAGSFRQGPFTEMPELGRGDTLFQYLDSNRRQTTAERAWYSRHIWKEGGLWQARTCFRSGELQRTESSPVASLKKQEGPFREYFRNGKAHISGTFLHGERDGQWLRWYESGQLADSTWYVKGRLHGPQIWYHETGHKSEEGVYQEDAAVSGSFWTSDGAPDPLGKPGIVYPRFDTSMGQDLSDYLNRTLQYPVSARDRGLQGRTVVQFLVLKKGQLTSVSTARSSGVAALDYEGLRVIRQMPTWVGGKDHNRPADIWFTLPITFVMH